MRNLLSQKIDRARNVCVPCRFSVCSFPFGPVAHLGSATLHLAIVAAAATVAEAGIVIQTLADDVRHVDVDYLNGGSDIDPPPSMPPRREGALVCFGGHDYIVVV